MMMIINDEHIRSSVQAKESFGSDRRRTLTCCDAPMVMQERTVSLLVLEVRQVIH